MQTKAHSKVTGFSGNEIFCLDKLGYKTGQLCVGNSVVALGVLRGIGSGLSNLAGGEIEQITQLVHDGRKNALNKMMQEVFQSGGVGVAGITFQLINHVGNLEFIAIGSTVHTENSTDTAEKAEKLAFSTSSSGQSLYCQEDAGFKPHKFVFSNIAYSIGVGGGIAGAFRSLKRGEVPQFTEIFNRTRHLALTRIKEEAKAAKANAVIGIETTIMPLLGAQEMIMTGTAAVHPALNDYFNDPVTCGMTNEELWNIVNLGYMPIRLVLGVSVVSLGFVSGVGSFLKNIAGGQVESLTELLYEAREKALARIQQDAQDCGADEVLGVQTRVYDMGGLVEFMVLGTAVKKIQGVTTKSNALLTQAIIQDRDTFVESSIGGSTSLNRATVAPAGSTLFKPISTIITIIIVVIYILIFAHGH